MSSENSDSRQQINAELYRALMEANEKRVIELSLRVPDLALHIMTVTEDTVLHMATYAKKADLALKLLDELPPHHLDKMTRQNRVGNTILHEVATSNHSRPIAEAILQKAPGLLGMRNNNGETALYRAARYGKAEIYKFLDAKFRISGFDLDSRQSYLVRNDKTNALHISILTQHFDLALKIAKDYPHLIGEQDSDGMTALQILACDSSAFKKEDRSGFVDMVKQCYSSQWHEKVGEEKERYKSAVNLAKFLVKRDTSWEGTYLRAEDSKPKIHKYGEVFAGSKTEQDKHDHAGETPLILATKSGCAEIVEEILKVFPQAVEHVDDEGRNVLHVAIRYRQLRIFEFIIQTMDVPLRRLVRKITNDGNTLLHMVAKKRKVFVSEKIEGPALLLQEELLWFERVKAVSLPHLVNHQNNMKQTPYEYFITENSELRASGKEWLKGTSEGCSVVAVLIATVAFAAAYTVPGGNETSGSPVLLHRPFFIVFTVADVLSLTFALSSVVIFLSILSSPFRFEDFKHSLPNRLVAGFTFLFFSVALMMAAFGATIILMVQNNESWAKISLYALSFIPVGIFGLSYFPIYSSLSKTYNYLFVKASKTIPFGAYLLSLPRTICFKNSDSNPSDIP